MKARLLVCLVIPFVVAAMPLEEIRPGRTNGFDLRARLGEPVGTGIGTGNVELAERFAAPAQGIASLTAWYDAQGVVRWARIVPQQELTPAAAVALFDLLSPPSLRAKHPFLENGADGRTEAYPREGVFLFVRGGVVREIWRTTGHPDETAIRAAVKALPDAAGPPAGPATGQPPEQPRAIQAGATSGERGASAVTASPSPAAAPARALSVDRMNAEPGEWQGVAGLWFSAPVRASGLAGRSVVAEVRIRTAAGESGRAPREAGATRGDAGEAVAGRAEDAVKFDEANWAAFRVLVPFALLDVPRGAPTRLIVTFAVRCEGMSASTEREFDFQRP